MNPGAGLVKSRKFWLLVLDTFITLLLYFVAEFAPVASEHVVFTIVALQPVFVAIILAIALEDAASKRAGTFRY